MSDYKTLFADILIPVPLPGVFTYRIPKEFIELVKEGLRVIVPFGSRRVITGIITRVHQAPPTDYEAKYVLDILDSEKVINHIQLSFFKWISEYYICTEGEVLNVALPSGFKISSESRIQLHPEYDKESIPFDISDHELAVIDRLLEKESLTYQDIHDLTGLKNIYSLLKSLIRKEFIIIYDEIKEKYQPKKEKRIRLTSEYNDEKALESLFETLEKKVKQTDVLLFYLNKVPVYQEKSRNSSGISKRSIIESGLSISSINTLVKNNILEEFEIIVSRFGEPGIQVQSKVDLSDHQKDTYNRILKEFQKNKPVLLHGITGSGKTEIYIELIQHALENEQQVLYLLPEIALTTQIVLRIKKIFGNKVGVYHSRHSDNERVEVWKGVLDGTFPVVIGVRSSIFLPFENLGIIIVDEEHEHSYKQHDPAPRYHARDSAFVLANLHHCNLLLGSATPSLESYQQSETGKISLINLEKRFGDAGLPEISFADLAREHKKKTMKGEFSGLLFDQINKTLNENKQVIIFQNRRGYAPYLRCITCGWIPNCENCDVSLTYHMYKNELRCHYCGYRERVPPHCSVCGSDQLESKSYGTEKLEEDLKLMFSDHTVKRMDLDTTRSKFGYQHLIEEFEKGAIDILVGTQMISKGLDFDHVGLVGIFDVDRMLHFPDFRSNERTFQLVTQVSGRAGRRKDLGTVIIQSYQPDQKILRNIKNHDYLSFYKDEIAERENFRYPPFYRLIRLSIKHKDKNIAQNGAKAIADQLRNQLSKERILGPEEGMIARIRNQYIYEIIIKLEKQGLDIDKIKSFIKDVTLKIKLEKEFRNIHLIFDVDPY